MNILELWLNAQEHWFLYIQKQKIWHSKRIWKKQQAKKANSKNRKFSSFTIVYHVSRTHRMFYIWPSLNATKNTLYVHVMRLHANVPFCYSVHLMKKWRKKNWKTTEIQLKNIPTKFIRQTLSSKMLVDVMVCAVCFGFKCGRFFVNEYVCMKKRYRFKVALYTSGNYGFFNRNNEMKKFFLPLYDLHNYQ